MQELRVYLTEVLQLADDPALTTVLAVQRALLPSRDGVPREQALPHDYLAFHRAMTAAKEAGRVDDWEAAVPKLREFGPSTFDADDRGRVGSFGLVAALYGVQPETSVPQATEAAVAV